MASPESLLHGYLPRRKRKTRMPCFLSLRPDLPGGGRDSESDLPYAQPQARVGGCALPPPPTQAKGSLPRHMLPDTTAVEAPARSAGIKACACMASENAPSGVEVAVAGTVGGSIPQTGVTGRA
jgi:hypothetical protein